MIATSGRSRARVAADVYARDYDHLLESTDCVVRIKRHKGEALMRASGFPMPTFWRMDLTARSFTVPSDGDVRGMLSIAGRNKRLIALLDLARATGSRVIFGDGDKYDVDVGIECDVTATEGRSPEALDAAARWMRIEHTEAVAALMGRAQGGCPDFRFDYPDDPTACILAVESSFADIATWVNAMRLDTQRSHLGSIAAIQELLNGISAKRLGKAQAKRLNEARAIAGRLLKAA